jgi:hypothetical protein
LELLIEDDEGIFEIFTEDNKSEFVNLRFPSSYSEKGGS